MNKIQWSNQGGKPVTQDDFNFMQGALQEMLTAIASALPNIKGSTKAFILSGCDTYLNGVTNTYWNNAGYVAINYVGQLEIYAVPAGDLGVGDLTTVNIDFKISDVSAYPDPDVFANGVSRNTHRQRTAVMNTTNQGPASYDPDFNLVNNMGSALAATSWRNVGGAGQPAFGNHWSALVTNVRFMKSKTGLVHLQGVAQSAIGSGPTPTIFTLPVGFRPGQDLVFSINRTDNAGAITPSTVSIGTNGQVTIDSTVFYGGFNYLLTIPAFIAEN